MKTATLAREFPVNWNHAVFLFIFHIGVIAALFCFSWQRLLSAFVFWTLTGMGIGIGFHRLLTHRGYKTYKIIEYCLTLTGCLGLQGGPTTWVGTHRCHHAETEVAGKDPHTPEDGKWWSHLGWIFRSDPQLHSKEFLNKYAPDLLKDPVHRIIDRFWYAPSVVLAMALWLIGGLPVVLWGIMVPITLGWHATWLVNSVTHLWGSRRFVTTDNSRNNWWVAILTFGEGWHNNHHAYQVSARHGLRWYEFDPNWWGIRTLRLVKLVWAVKTVSYKTLLYKTT